MEDHLETENNMQNKQTKLELVAYPINENGKEEDATQILKTTMHEGSVCNCFV